MKLGLMTKDECIDFIEFNTTGDNDNFNKCDPESWYLDSNIFNVFAGCFERSNYLFEFIGHTKYNSRKIVPLQNELKENLSKVWEISNVDEFKQFITGVFLGRDLLIDLAEADPDYERNWIYYLRRMIVINRDLIALIDRCIAEERILWVIGY